MTDALVTALRDACGDAAVIDDPAQIQPYVTDWRGQFVGTAVAVVRPATTEQVRAVVKACATFGAAVVPQGGNTGLAAGATPLALDTAVVVNLSRMRRILKLDAEAYTIVVEAGAVLSEVQEAASRAQRLFPLSLAAEGSAQIGGLIATNAGGTAVLRYGSMRALVLGLEVVLADGRIADGLRSLYKDNAGYDWKQLFIGSEGTLGIITRAVLRLFPVPRSHLTALIGLQSASAALTAFTHLQAALGETLTACELIPDRALGLRLTYESSLRRPMSEHAWYLLIEVSSTLSALREEAQAALAELEANGTAQSIVVAETSSQEHALWEWRETITETEKRAGPSIKHDVSVPISDIPSFIERATAAIERDFTGTSVLAFGHFGDGNIHFNVLLPADGSVAADDVSSRVYTMISNYRGSITAEHGIGRYRRSELLAHRSSVEVSIMNDIKTALDPTNAMNPGAVLDSGLRG